MNTDRVDVLYQKHDFDLDMDLLNPRVVHETGSKIAQIIGSEKAGDHVVSGPMFISLYAEPCRILCTIINAIQLRFSNIGSISRLSQLFYFSYTQLTS